MLTRELYGLAFFNSRVEGGRRLQSNVGVRENLYEVLQPDQSNCDNREKNTNGEEVGWSCCWVPHPRSGIYSPKGQEWVLNDVPENAASFSHTYWIRNVDDTLDHKTNL
ncbi:hypothetical protein ACFE04_007678 [Oxalis oulophora]